MNNIYVWEDSKLCPPFVQEFGYQLLLGLFAVIKHCLYCKREKATPVPPFMDNVRTDRL